MRSFCMDWILPDWHCQMNYKQGEQQMEGRDSSHRFKEGSCGVVLSHDGCISEGSLDGQDLALLWRQTSLWDICWWTKCAQFAPGIFRSPIEPDFPSENTFSCAQMAQLLAEMQLWRNCEGKSKVMDRFRNSLVKQRQCCGEGKLSLLFGSALIWLVIVWAWADSAKSSLP